MTPVQEANALIDKLAAMEVECPLCAAIPEVEAMLDADPEMGQFIDRDAGRAGVRAACGCDGTGKVARVPGAWRKCPSCFVCSDHGRGVAVDEDGCCVTCGVEARECDEGQVINYDAHIEALMEGVTARQAFEVYQRLQVAVWDVYIECADELMPPADEIRLAVLKTIYQIRRGSS